MFEKEDKDILSHKIYSKLNYLISNLIIKFFINM